MPIQNFVPAELRLTESFPFSSIEFSLDFCFAFRCHVSSVHWQNGGDQPVRGERQPCPKINSRTRLHHMVMLRIPVRHPVTRSFASPAMDHPIAPDEFP